jgi:hypothetical protein
MSFACRNGRVSTASHAVLSAWRIDPITALDVNTMPRRPATPKPPACPVTRRSVRWSSVRPRPSRRGSWSRTKLITRERATWSSTTIPKAATVTMASGNRDSSA